MSAGSSHLCSDDIECNQSNVCPQHSTCYNTVGSYGCTCHEGYYKTGTTCSNENECTLGTHNCEQKCTGSPMS